MALTVEDLYRQYAGRTGDTGGIDYFNNLFGPTIEPEEAARFATAISEARAQGSEPVAAAPVVPKTVEDLYTTVLNRAPDESGLAFWKGQFGSSVDQGEISRFQEAAFDEISQQKTGSLYNLASQILGTSDTSKWSGQGFGSAEKNALDMARILSGIGITDVSQFGQIEVPVDVAVRPVYEYIPEGYGDSASYTARIAGYTDQNGNPVDPSLVKPSMTWSGSGDGGGYEAIYTAPIGTQTAYGNKVTGQVVPNTYGERQTGDAFGGTYSGKGNTGYRAQFTPDGKPVFYTSAQSSSSLPELMPILTIGALALGLGGGLEGLFGAGAGTAGAAGAAGAGVTDAAFLAADAAQLAAQGLTESQIASTLGSYGSSAASNLAASMAANGLDVGTMTQQLGNLGTNTGLMSQTGSSADFLSADALQLQGQVGNNFAAIEQNLVASGVDPLVAADVSQQLAFNPGLTQADLATNLSNSFGNNIYDVNMAATYPTSSLPGSGGLLSDVAGGAAGVTAAPVGTTTGAPAATTSSGTGLSTSQIANLVKAGVGLLGAGGAASLAGGGGSNASFQAPTQQVPTNSPEYYNQLQQYYNAYLPQTPRDVVTPLQQWYNSSYGA